MIAFLFARRHQRLRLLELGQDGAADAQRRAGDAGERARAPRDGRAAGAARRAADAQGLPHPRATSRTPSPPGATRRTRRWRRPPASCELLDRDELEGVIAHELAHIKNRDILTMTVAATVAGAISMLAQFGFFFGGGRDRDNPHGADRGDPRGDLRAAGGDADPDDDQPHAGVFRRPAGGGDQRQAAGAGERAAQDLGLRPAHRRCRAPSATRPRRRSSSSTR